MKQSKKLSFTLQMLIAISAIFTLNSCKKYPDNMGISLRSRNERVANTWKVENYKVNNDDFTSLVADYSETFSKGGSYSYVWGNLSESTTWTFQNHDKEIKLNGSDKQASRTLIILKLEEKTFWYYYMDGSDRHELHLIEK